jgi:hypothetical protein
METQTRDEKRRAKRIFYRDESGEKGQVPDIPRNSCRYGYAVVLRGKKK